MPFLPYNFEGSWSFDYMEMHATSLRLGANSTTFLKQSLGSCPYDWPLMVALP